MVTPGRRLIAALVAARRAQGVTRREMARRLKLSEDAVRHLERGHYEPSLPNLTRYAAAIGFQLDIRLVAPDRCGSPAGYRRHARRGQVACRPCLDAESFRKRESRRRAA